jgi:hypothetical protein
MVGIVVMTSPTCNPYKIVGFPAPSSPKIKILISQVQKRLEKILEKKPPMMNCLSALPILTGRPGLSAAGSPGSPYKPGLPGTSTVDSQWGRGEA